jgi:hypothetical protein
MSKLFSLFERNFSNNLKEAFFDDTTQVTTQVEKILTIEITSASQLATELLNIKDVEGNCDGSQTKNNITYDKTKFLIKNRIDFNDRNMNASDADKLAGIDTINYMFFDKLKLSDDNYINFDNIIITSLNSTRESLIIVDNLNLQVNITTISSTCEISNLMFMRMGKQLCMRNDGLINNCAFTDINFEDRTFTNNGIDTKIPAYRHIITISNYGEISNCFLVKNTITSKIQASMPYCGLVCFENYGAITACLIENCNMESISTDTGGGVCVQNSNTIYNCVLQNCVFNNFMMGGICYINNNIIETCLLQNVTLNSYMCGGICYYNLKQIDYTPTISYCSFKNFDNMNALTLGRPADDNPSIVGGIVAINDNGTINNILIEDNIDFKNKNISVAGIIMNRYQNKNQISCIKINNNLNSIALIAKYMYINGNSEKNYNLTSSDNINISNIFFFDTTSMSRITSNIIVNNLPDMSNTTNTLPVSQSYLSIIYNSNTTCNYFNDSSNTISMDTRLSAASTTTAAITTAETTAAASTSTTTAETTIASTAAETTAASAASTASAASAASAAVSSISAVTTSASTAAETTSAETTAAETTAAETTAASAASTAAASTAAETTAAASAASTAAETTAASTAAETTAAETTAAETTAAETTAAETTAAETTAAETTAAETTAAETTAAETTAAETTTASTAAASTAASITTIAGTTTRPISTTTVVSFDTKAIEILETTELIAEVKSSNTLEILVQDINNKYIDPIVDKMVANILSQNSNLSANLKLTEDTLYITFSEKDTFKNKNIENLYEGISKIIIIFNTNDNSKYINKYTGNINKKVFDINVKTVDLFDIIKERDDTVSLYFKKSIDMDKAEEIIHNVNRILYGNNMSYYQYKQGNDLYIIFNGPELFSNNMVSPSGSIKKIIFVFYTIDYKDAVYKLSKINKNYIYGSTKTTNKKSNKNYKFLRILIILLLIGVLIGLVINILNNYYH